MTTPEQPGCLSIMGITHFIRLIGRNIVELHNSFFPAENRTDAMEADIAANQARIEELRQEYATRQKFIEEHPPTPIPPKE